MGSPPKTCILGCGRVGATIPCCCSRGCCKAWCWRSWASVNCWNDSSYRVGENNECISGVSRFEGYSGFPFDDLHEDLTSLCAGSSELWGWREFLLSDVEEDLAGLNRDLFGVSSSQCWKRSRLSLASAAPVTCLSASASAIFACSWNSAFLCWIFNSFDLKIIQFLKGS